MNGTIPANIKALLFSKRLFGSYAAGCRIIFQDKLTNNVLYNVENVTVSNEESQFNGSASFSVINVNPDDHKDYGYYTPYRSASLKPQNEWYKVILPSKKIRIEMGYYNSWIPVFTGYISNITMTYSNESASIDVNCVDVLGYFCNKQWINHTTPVEVDQIDSFYLEVPIPLGYNQAWLTPGLTTDPTIEDTVKELLVRAGININYIYIEATGMTPINTEWEKVTYASALEELKNQSQFNLFCDGYGVVNFKPKQNRDTIRTGTRTLTANEWCIEFNYQIVDDINNITVKNSNNTITYVNGVDYILDIFKNAIRRTSIAFGDANNSNISSGNIVNITYKNCDYIFKNGVNIFKLDYELDHQDMYGSYYVNGEAGESWQYITDGLLWDGSYISLNSVKEIQNDTIQEEADIIIKCQREIQDAKERYMQCSLNTIGIPWLNIHDICQLYVYGAVRELYIIKGYNLSYSNGSIIGDYKFYHYAYNALV